MKCRVIHNPRCSKSRDTLTLLTENNVEFETIDYLGGELTLSILDEALNKLGLKALDIVRTKEDEYKSLNIDWSDEAKAKQAILNHPKILERPIVLFEDKAIISRPAERVLDIL